MIPGLTIEAILTKCPMESKQNKRGGISLSRL